MTLPADILPLPPGLLLQRIAAELESCQMILARIEGCMHALLADVPVNEALRRRDFQDIDLLGQLLGDLALCLTASAQTRPLRAGGALEGGVVLANLRLHDLRERLSGGEAQEVAADQVELF